MTRGQESLVMELERGRGRRGGRGAARGPLQPDRPARAARRGRAARAVPGQNRRGAQGAEASGVVYSIQHERERDLGKNPARTHGAKSSIRRHRLGALASFSIAWSRGKKLYRRRLLHDELGHVEDESSRRSGTPRRALPGRQALLAARHRQVAIGQQQRIGERASRARRVVDGVALAKRISEFRFPGCSSLAASSVSAQRGPAPCPGRSALMLRKSMSKSALWMMSSAPPDEVEEARRGFGEAACAQDPRASGRAPASRRDRPRARQVDLKGALAARASWRTRRSRLR